MDAIACQGFGGAFALGVTQAGFRLDHVVEQAGGFGTPMLEGNRHLLGPDWVAQACDASEWEPRDVAMVFGNPPCSGFSGLSVAISDGHGVRRDWRGSDNPINNCMWDLVRYGAACKAEAIVFESVQAAGKSGHPLMQALHAELERLTGKQWYLSHVFHNNLSLGGNAMRKRYFWVATQVPFGVELPELDGVGSLRKAIGDLEDVPLGAQWPEGHVIRSTPRARRVAWLAEHAGWEPGERSDNVCARVDLPDALFRRPDGRPLGTTEMKNGPYAARRWKYDAPARVLTGYSLSENAHPALPRTFTHREVARIMGYPDSWSCQPNIAHGAKGELWWGKQIPVGSGAWIAWNVYAALLGQRGSIHGDEIGEREVVLDSTNHWKTGLAA